MRRYATDATVVGGPASPAMAWPLFLPQIFLVFFSILCLLKS